MKRTRLRFSRGAHRCARQHARRLRRRGRGKQRLTPQRQSVHRPSRARRRPPSIEDAAYSFSPSATDADGDALMFGIDAQARRGRRSTPRPGYCPERRPRPTSACIAASSSGCRTAAAQTVAAAVRRRRSWRTEPAPTGRRRSRGAPATIGRSSATPYTFTPTATRPRRPTAHVLDPQSPGVGDIRRGDGAAAGHAARSQRGHVRRRHDLGQRRAGGRAAAVRSRSLVDAAAGESRARHFGRADDERRSGHGVHVRADGERSGRQHADVRDHGSAELGRRSIRPPAG